MATFKTLCDGGIFNIEGHNPVAVRLVSCDGGAAYLDVRKMWRNAEGAICPTREGVTIKAAEMVAFVNSLAKCAEAAGAGKPEAPAPKAAKKVKGGKK